MAATSRKALTVAGCGLEHHHLAALVDADVEDQRSPVRGAQLARCLLGVAVRRCRRHVADVAAPQVRTAARAALERARKLCGHARRRVVRAHGKGAKARNKDVEERL